jgi:hypothetical protein
MRRTIRGRGARGFDTWPHGYEQRDIWWSVLAHDYSDHNTILVSTATCRCGKRDTRIVDMSWDPVALPRVRAGERYELRRPVNFEPCRKLPAMLSLRGALA